MSKSDLYETTKLLREAAQRQDPAARLTISLVRLLADAEKESLVTADGDDMLRRQGAVRSLEKLYKELTVVPPSITRSGVKTNG